MIRSLDPAQLEQAKVLAAQIAEAATATAIALQKITNTYDNWSVSPALALAAYIVKNGDKRK